MTSKTTSSTSGPTAGPTSDDRRGRPRLGFGAALQLIMALVIANAVLVPIFAFRSRTELDVYVRAADRLLDRAEIYRPDEGLPAFSYPPFFALPVTPLVPLHETLQRLAWASLNVSLAVGVVAMLWTLLRPRLVPGGKPAPGAHPHVGVLYWVFFGLLSARFMLSPLENQSHDLIIAALVTAAAFCAARGRDGASGALVGIAAACKATPLLFLPVFLVARRWRAAGAMLAAVVVCSILPDVLLPRADGQRSLLVWLDVARGAARPGQSGGDVIWGAWNHLNQNLAGTVYRLTAPPGSDQDMRPVNAVTLGDGARSVITTGLQGLVGLVVVFVASRRPRRRGAEPGRAEAGVDSSAFAHLQVAQFGVVACGMILLSPMSSKAHFGVLALAVSALVAARLLRAAPVLTATLAGALVLSTFVAKGLIGKAAGDLALSVGTTTFAVVSLLIGLTWLVLRWPWPPGGTSADPRTDEVTGSDAPSTGR